jgi:hypothetical protein
MRKFFILILEIQRRFVAETFCSEDVVLQVRSVTETFCMETFCRGDVLWGDVRVQEFGTSFALSTSWF